MERALNLGRPQKGVLRSIYTSQFFLSLTDTQVQTCLHLITSLTQCTNIVFMNRLTARRLLSHVGQVAPLLAAQERFLDPLSRRVVGSLGEVGPHAHDLPNRAGMVDGEDQLGGQHLSQVLRAQGDGTRKSQSSSGSA